jgi:hypothetical protein
MLRYTTMVVETTIPPSELMHEFVQIAHRIVWCTVATADRRGRPRSRVLHPYWELADGRMIGWVVTRATPLKVAHLERVPYVSCCYWDPAHDVVIADCRADWVADVETREHAWRLFRDAPPPLGHDPAQIFPDGPGSPDSAVLRLSPWRRDVAAAETASAGEPPLAWRGLE